ncbi:MAG: sugar ABC transporter substrate-binding protein [Candidatus Competibacteraceae bacterium]|nr:sugar ABC transporter substrate-binding protein [Candidatus Competibacteraceae bacterium]
MKKTVLSLSIAAALLSVTAQAATTVTIGTVNNGDMIIMQRLSKQFEKQHPDIKLDWVVLEENVLRQRLTTDIATKSGQFDVATIGAYEVPIWAKQGWLKPFENLSADYDVDDILQSVRNGLSYEGKLYALPFYSESSMLFYRTDLFKKAGIEMPTQPTWDQVKGWAGKLSDKDAGVYGICLRGKPGWGENVAFLSTMVHSYGGQWFDMKWQPTLDSPEWKAAVTDYVNLLNQYGPPGAASNGFNENLSLFASGKCAMWIDATVAAGLLFNPDKSQVADKVGFAQAPIGKTEKGSHWIWSWALAIPNSSDAQDAATQFITWATSKSYVELVGQQVGWTSVPPGTRRSTYENAKYTEAAPFAQPVLQAIESADPTHPTLNPSPYTGIQYVGIPEFQAIGTQVGQTIAAALAGQMSVDQALKGAQSSVSRTMRQAGYGK